MEEVLERESILMENVGAEDFRDILPLAKKIDISDRSIRYIVLAIDNPNFKFNKPSSEIKVFGKTMVEWVSSACERPPVVLKVEYDHNPITEIKPYLDDSEWTIVLYSDTLLLTSDTIAKCITYAESKELNVCRLERGFIFKTEYVKRIEEVYGLESCNINLSDFSQATDFVTLAEIQKTLKQRIFNFHSRNGVQIIDYNSTYIESDVSIGAGTIVYPNNTLCGNTEIGENVQIFSGNRILNSIITGDATIEGSTITNSVVGAKCKVKNSIIGNDVLIKNSCKIMDCSNIKESVIDEECKVMGATIKGAYLNKNCKVYDGARLIGKNGNIVLKNNAVVHENAIVSVACEINEAKVVREGTVINK